MTDSVHKQQAQAQDSARREPARDREHRRPDENVVPRQNPPVDDYDVERGRGKLELVIGK